MVVKKGNGAVSGSNSGPNRTMVVKKGKGAITGSNSGRNRPMVVKKGKGAVSGSNSGPNRPTVLKKGKGVVSGSNSGPNSNDAVNTSQNEPIVASSMVMNAKESGLSPQNEDKEENLSKEVMNEENEILGKKRGRIAIEEEDNEKTVIDRQEQHEENGMEEEKINELNAIEVKGNEQNVTDKEEKEEKREVEHAKNEKSLGANSQEKVKVSKKRRRTKKVIQGDSEIVAPKAEDKPGSSSKKDSKRAESMGMIFMCSSKTKQDCYRYKVFGLPVSKKDIVEKVYKGMRLFLFDFDLRLMYGIYKAAGPGGYNIEPKAFKSAFPSQVRFSVLEDCLPLPEKEFKRIIKDNYYAKNKFDCQLTSKQVKDLCKLFVASSRGSKYAERSGKNLRAETRISSKSKRPRRNLRAETHTYLDREQIRQKSQGNDKHSALVVDQCYYNRPIMYERETFASAGVPLSQLPPLPAPPALTPSYASYWRTLEMDVYRQDPLVEHHDRQLLDLAPRHRDEIISRDSYFSSVEPLYRRDPLHSAGLLPEHYSPPGLRPEYRHLAALPSEYSHPAGPPSEYGSLQSFYRY